jgi:hypothetical protein
MSCRSSLSKPFDTNLLVASDAGGAGELNLSTAVYRILLSMDSSIGTPSEKSVRFSHELGTPLSDRSASSSRPSLQDIARNMVSERKPVDESGLHDVRDSIRVIQV